MGREAAVVTLKIDSELSDENRQKLSQIAKRLAMHVVSSLPSFLLLLTPPLGRRWQPSHHI
jgi:hypothetical protein